MVIREAGLLFRGYSLINAKYHQAGFEIDNDLRSGLFTAILNFAEQAFLKNDIEYLEGDEYVIAFYEGEIKSEASQEKEPLIAYAILDKEKKIERYVHKVLHPLLKKILFEFKKYHEGKYLSEISQFRGFKKILDSIFGADTQTVEQKFEGLFSD
ncbi:MAG: hypothetical protein EU521_01020 [Promethearchaeota archaeon]|nr:MAG: hypothetical protein EU521_01020 [Candidatus Lokiarchaeota archaeon]